MMIRALTVSLLFAVLAVPAYAQDAGTNSSSDPAPQDNPQTRQTDESEDDYRRSQRRRDTGDIFEDIGINRGSSGSGGTILGREVKAIDRLDQESRRHLNKQRAKALAEAQPGEPIDAAYEPSETAKTDEYVARQEEAAWEEMLEEANSGLSGTQGQGTGQGGGSGSGQGDQQDQGQAGGGQQGQAGQGQPGQGQQGQSGQGQGSQSGQSDQARQPSNSPLRGGSASSASSILDRIKGRTGSGGGTAPQTGQTSGGGQAPQGQAPQGQSTQSGQAQQGQASQGQSQQDQSSADGQSQSEAQAQAQAQADASAQAASDAQNQAQAQAASDAQAAADAASAQAAAEPNAAAEAAAHQETMSPLERLKRDPVERSDTGGRTSASDYLNRGKKN